MSGGEKKKVGSPGKERQGGPCRRCTAERREASERSEKTEPAASFNSLKRRF